jgi:hypothetical protein
MARVCANRALKRELIPRIGRRKVGTNRYSRAAGSRRGAFFTLDIQRRRIGASRRGRALDYGEGNGGFFDAGDRDCGEQSPPDGYCIPAVVHPGRKIYPPQCTNAAARDTCKGHMKGTHERGRQEGLIGEQKPIPASRPRQSRLHGSSVTERKIQPP